MSLTVANVYEVRFCEKLPLPQLVQDNIARLRISPATYKPVRPPMKHKHKHDHSRILPDNWRENVLKDYVSKLKDKGDADYFDMFGILNKLAPSNLDKLTGEALELLKKRDEQFRLRCSTLMFNKAITDSLFSVVIADMAKKLVETFPDIKTDFQTQIEMFPKLYDINDTITYPVAGDPEFDNKVVLWMSQKQKKRGCAKFMTQLYVRDMVSTESMKQSLQVVIRDLEELVRKPKTETTEETTTSLVDFLFECSKVLPPTASELRATIHSSGSDILKIPRAETTSLCMRSRFKLEDTVKCVQ
jgi:hypothetical protein